VAVLRGVFHLRPDGSVVVKRFSSPLRESTPASPIYESQEDPGQLGGLRRRPRVSRHRCDNEEWLEWALDSVGL
jgi:hypothetical protein